MRKLAFANRKRDAGKTTTAVTLSHGLAHEKMEVRHGYVPKRH